MCHCLGLLAHDDFMLYGKIFQVYQKHCFCFLPFLDMSEYSEVFKKPKEFVIKMQLFIGNDLTIMANLLAMSDMLVVMKAYK
jgi:hypothetical protein